MPVSLPPYLDEITDPAEQTEAKTRFLLRLAALYFSPSGQIKVLSDAIGYHENSLASVTSISPKLAVKLEEALGADLFPRELLNPIFVKE